MKILLILPAGEAYRVTRETATVPRRKMLRFSILPLTTVAALTPAGHEVAICDENVQPVDLETDADVIGISFMTALAPRACELAGEFRRRGKTVIAGGYHPTLCPDEVVRHVDAVVVGDAEELWPQALRDVERGALRPLYRQAHPCALAGRPAPRRDLMRPTGRLYATTCAVQATRGCPHRCTYCSIAAIHGGSLRTRPVPEVIAELTTTDRDFIFVDDNLVADPEYARQLFRAMTPLRKRWVAQCSLHIADDPQLLGLASQAGCKGLFIGIETSDPANLRAVGKDFNAERALAERVAAIRRHGIGVIAGIIVGMDNDTPEAFERTLAMLQRLRIDAVQVNIFTPLPGTPLHAELERRGRIVDARYDHYDFRHAVIQPLRMTRQELQDGADWLYSQFYRLDRILLRGARALLRLGVVGAVLGLRLNLTYRYDNRREGIRGRNPASRLAPRRPIPSGDATPSPAG
jgi:radical SAM superfamily enzyme YgiQ (UPF0313 family)